MKKLLSCLVSVGLVYFVGERVYAGESVVALMNHFEKVVQSDGLPVGWRTAAPRPEAAPVFSVDAKSGREGGAALRIETRSNPSAFGYWQTKITNVVGGRTYRFSAWYRAVGVPFERRCVSARLEWLDADGKGVRPPDYPLDNLQQGRWTRVEYVTTVPEAARQLDLRLGFGFVPRAKVWWDEIKLLEEPGTPRRLVRAATIFYKPSGSKSAAENVEKFCAVVEQAAVHKPDIICLPEGITVVGTGKKHHEVSESVPGPTCERLGALARKLNAYIVAGIYEREKDVVYNTAVLIGRRGELVGKYRKTHLPREEWGTGLMYGDEYPVFTTDFGKVGIMICWDLQFPEAARALAAQGAEIILLPIWGGNETLWRARAIENCVYVVSSSYDMKSGVVDPVGQVLAEATAQQPVVCVELDLEKQYHQRWLGDMKTRTWREWRPELFKPGMWHNRSVK